MPETAVFHITHIDNLPSIAKNGIICDSSIHELGDPVSIGNVGIKARRAETLVPVGAGGTIADYVPFYFCPRSPMLYSIKGNWVPGAEDTHDDIVHLALSAESVAANNPGFVFTNGHAVMNLSDFFEDIDETDGA